MIIADTHAHLYPRYDVGKFLSTAAANLAALASGTTAPTLLLCLTERRECRYYQMLLSGKLILPSSFCQLEVLNNGESLACTLKDGRRIFIIPGRQVACHEGLELLAIGADLPLQDGLPMAEVLATIVAERATPILPWGLGKWTFQRASIVRRWLEETDPSELVIGDSALRPSIPEHSSLLTLARARGFRIVAGTDPLPSRGEELRVGSYATGWELEFDLQAPTTSVQRMFRTSGKLLGQRLSPPQVMLRWMRCELDRRLNR